MKVACCIALLVACGTDAKAIDLVVPGQPTLVAAKLAGAWQTLAGSFDGAATTYGLTIDGEFEIVVARTCPTYTAESELFGAVDDAELAIGSWDLRACDPIDQGAPITVTGTFGDAQYVAFDDGGPQHTSGAPTFAAQTTAGVHDVVAWNGSRMQITHDIALSDGMDLGTPSFGADSGLLLVKEFAVAVDPDEEVTTTVDLVTRNRTAVSWSQAPEHVLFMPHDQLAQGDEISFSFFAFGEDDARYGFATQFADVPPNFDLLPRIPQVAAAPGIGVMWTPFAAFFTTATVEVAAPGIRRDVTVAKSWLANHPGGEIVFDADAPGLAVSDVHGVSRFRVTRWNHDVSVTSETSKITD